MIDHFPLIDETKTMSSATNDITYTLPYKEPYYLKLRMNTNKKLATPNLSINSYALHPLSTKIKKDKILYKYYIPKEAVIDGENTLTLHDSPHKERILIPTFTIKNYRSKPVYGMFVIDNKSHFYLNKDTRIAPTKKTLITAVLFLICISICVYIFTAILGLPLSHITLLYCTCVFPVILFYVIIMISSSVSHYTILLLPNFYMIPFISIYLLCFYPLWKKIRNIVFFKKMLICFTYTALGCMIFLILGLTTISQFFANVSFVVLGIAVLIAFWKNVKGVITIH
ncbi:MAG: hypothetical protein P9M13_00860 [Candidatus Ancaeobacter aquaticus]|nr:hypothetical protein [Candidatus Ancaeobacter aquaticus]